MVAHLNFVMPSPSWRRMSSGILWVFICGRSRAAPPATAILLQFQPLVIDVDVAVVGDLEQVDGCANCLITTSVVAGGRVRAGVADGPGHGEVVDALLEQVRHERDPERVGRDVRADLGDVDVVGEELPHLVPRDALADSERPVLADGAEDRTG